MSSDFLPGEYDIATTISNNSFFLPSVSLFWGAVNKSAGKLAGTTRISWHLHCVYFSIERCSVILVTLVTIWCFNFETFFAKSLSCQHISPYHLSGKWGLFLAVFLGHGSNVGTCESTYLIFVFYQKDRCNSDTFVRYKMRCPVKSESWVRCQLERCRQNKLLTCWGQNEKKT